MNVEEELFKPAKELTEAELLSQPSTKDLIELCAIINIEEVKPNSIIALRIKDVTQSLLLALSEFSRRYGEQLKKKNISMMVLGPNDKIEEMPEEQMVKAGWVKKEKNRIITL